MTGAEEVHLQHYLHEHIPISAALGVSVAAASHDRIELRAPLSPNINHRSTVFGGSAAAVAILAGWSLLHVRLGRATPGNLIVIQKHSIEYLTPIDGEFMAVTTAPASADWTRFLKTYERHGMSRLDLVTTLHQGTRLVGTATGSYVLLPGPTSSRSRRPEEHS